MAKAKLVQGRGVMEQPALAAFVLANQGVGDDQGDVVAEGRQAVDFWDGGGQGLRAGLEADDVIDAAHRQAVKVARHPDIVVVEERGHVDDLGQLAADEGGDKGDRKSTRLNSSHANISYAVFCLKK